MTKIQRLLLDDPKEDILNESKTKIIELRAKWDLAMRKNAQ